MKKYDIQTEIISPENIQNDQLFTIKQNFIIESEVERNLEHNF